ncbi:MAG TPA: EutN/CcmL family microcompartment protein [Terracidiphilus sp.]|nr:EutN/CcmL family microcompartment protein [Terracidiphilus sp.]
MFLARIAGAAVAAAKHPTLDGCRFLIAERLEADGSTQAEPIVVVDWMGAASGSTVMVSTDGDIARARFGNTTPARLVVVGIVDRVQSPAMAAEATA